MRPGVNIKLLCSLLCYTHVTIIKLSYLILSYLSTCEIPVKLTVNTESRRKVKISCALTVKLCTCVRLIKLNNTVCSFVAGYSKDIAQV